MLTTTKYYIVCTTIHRIVLCTRFPNSRTTNETYTVLLSTYYDWTLSNYYNFIDRQATEIYGWSVTRSSVAYTFAISLVIVRSIDSRAQKTFASGYD